MVVFMLLSGIGAGQTLQPTTIATQASVSRKDMSVVTVFRNFVRNLGGTLALAVGSTIICVLTLILLFIPSMRFTFFEATTSCVKP
ncbi:hypothetical protein EV421DRAFT_1821364 [Armillaria borealis]|uniref:Major facilitator superfamily (MFS) profile domain-containing protein n=1 Tax=Armillaria borealis TaxID=47425 RepID=A0AA39MMQ4_9AGAR|nr:hypothetical protein EV421DRAFT_1821364 [Armillaria borealis]